jgi:hypothetical protein
MFNLTPAFRAERLKQLRTTPRGGSDFRHAIDNPTGLMDLLDFANANGPFPVLDVLELGSDRGVSTEVFLNRVTRVTAVDPWDYTRLQNYPETGTGVSRERRAALRRVHASVRPVSEPHHDPGLRRRRDAEDG